MNKRISMILGGLLSLSLSCSLFNQIVSETPDTATPFPEIATNTSNLPAPATLAPTNTAIPPSKTPLPPTKPPSPTSRPTSMPLVLEDEAFQADTPKDCGTDTRITGVEGSIFTTQGGTLSVVDGNISLWCYGARHTWVGTTEYAGYTFASHASDPLQFQVEPDAGYRFIGGVGTLTYPDGTQVELFMPTHAITQPPPDTPVGLECYPDSGISREYIAISSPFITHSVVLDGKITSASEWSQATCADLRLHAGIDFNSSNTRLARWWVQNDGQFVYFLARVPVNISLNGVVVEYFWPVYTGTWAHSDGSFVNKQGEPSDITNWDEQQWYDDMEMQPPGTVDVQSSATQDGEFYWFEFKKALSSGDRYDWSVKIGQTIGNNPSDSLFFGLILPGGDFFTRYVQLSLGEP